MNWLGSYPLGLRLKVDKFRFRFGIVMCLVMLLNRSMNSLRLRRMMFHNTVGLWIVVNRMGPLLVLAWFGTGDYSHWGPWCLRPMYSASRFRFGFVVVMMLIWLGLSYYPDLRPWGLGPVYSANRFGFVMVVVLFRLLLMLRRLGLVAHCMKVGLNSSLVFLESLSMLGQG